MAREWFQRSMQKLSSEAIKRKCPECKSTDVAFERGELFCKKCGYVLSD